MRRNFDPHYLFGDKMSEKVLLLHLTKGHCWRFARSRLLSSRAAHLKCLEAGEESNAIRELFELVIAEKQLPQTRKRRGWAGWREV